MQPPKCPTCGKSEWGHLCSGVAQTERPAAKPVKSARKAPEQSTPPKKAEASSGDPNPVARKRAPRGSGFDKKAYQRELMRKRRAKRFTTPGSPGRQREEPPGG